MATTTRCDSVVWRSLFLLVSVAVCLGQIDFFDNRHSFQQPVSAVVDIKGTTKFPGISGQIHFTQTTTGGPVIVRGTIFGLTPGLHGLHIHQFGSLADNCNAAGPHFNPFNNDHGGVSDESRHVGDLGNIDAIGDYHTQADIFLFDHLISLSQISERSILRRAVVIHEKADDLGLGYHPDSKKTGNSGSRIACGIITIASPRSPHYY